MASKLSLLQGEVNDCDEIASGDIEKLIAGFLRTLLDEQRQGQADASVTPSERETLVPRGDSE